MSAKSTFAIACLWCCLAWTGSGQVNPNNPAGSPPAAGGARSPNAGGRPNSGPAGGAHPHSPRPAQAAPVHVYSKKADGWTELHADVAYIQSSKQDNESAPGTVKGYVHGAHSETRLTAPSELSLSAPEGIAVAKLQLLHLHAEGDLRIFLVTKGEPGSSRDAVALKAKEVAPHTYVLSFSTLTSGDYGLLVPFSGGTSGSSERLGRLYTFRVVK